MAQVIAVKLRGGPYDGQLKDVVTTGTLPLTLTYGTSVYDYVADSANPPVYAYNAAASKGAPPGIASVTRQWTRLMRALGHEAPRNLRRIHNSALHIRRMTRQHR